MEFQLLPEVTELHSKNSLLRLKSSHPAISKQTLSMGFPAVTVFGADWRNKQMPSNAGKQNMSEMSSIAAKAPTFSTMHGWTTIDCDNAKVIDKGDIVCEKTLGWQD